MSNTNQNISIEPTWGIAARVWWWFIWRATLASIGGGLLIGFVFGIVAALLKVDQGVITIVSMVLGGAVGVYMSIFFFKKLLAQDFGAFSIRLES